MLSSHIEHALNTDEDQGQHAHTDAGPPRAQGSVELQDGNDRAVDQDPKEGADHTAHTAGQQRTPDHHRGNGIQFHAGGIAAIAGEQRNTPDNPGQGGTKAAKGIHRDLCAPDRQTHQPGRLFIIANRIDCAAEACVIGYVNDHD